MSWFHRLTEAQWRAAKAEALEAITEHRLLGHRDETGMPPDAFLQNNALGIAGEIAFSRMTGLPRLGKVHGPGYGLPDFAPDIEIVTRSDPTYDLLIRRKRDPGRRYVLIVATGLRVFEAKGWLYGIFAMQPPYLQTYGSRPAAYFVPQADLWQMDRLELPAPEQQQVALPW